MPDVVGTSGVGPVRYKDMGDGTFALVVVPGVPLSGGGTLRVNSGSVAPGQSLKTYTGKVALSATLTTTTTLETVTAGKTYIITDIYLSHDTALVLDVRIQAAGADIFRAPVKGDTAPTQMPGIESQPVAAAGQLVTILWPIAAGPPNAYFFIGGLEQ